jgi:hypothetical protein
MSRRRQTAIIFIGDLRTCLLERFYFTTKRNAGDSSGAVIIDLATKTISCTAPSIQAAGLTVPQKGDVVTYELRPDNRKPGRMNIL